MNEREADAVLSLILMKNKHDLMPREDKIYKNKTRKQVKFLQAVYEITKYPSSSTRINMSALINISSRKIQIWFQNKRQAEKEEIYMTKSGGEDNAADSKEGSVKHRSYNIKSNDILQLYLEC